MAIRRHYINNGAVVSTVGSMSNVATTVTVSDASTFPASYPWTAAIDAGLATAEVVLVTAAAGAVLTITRGYDGTAAQAHASAATFAHVAVQADYDEANAHHVATSGVHGVSGSVVGTTDVQTLSNKTLAAPILTGTTAGANATLSGTLAVTGATTLSGGATVTGAVSATTTVTATGAVTGGSLVTGGTVAATGAATAASFTANGNGAVGGVVVPKSYTNEAAATAAGANVTGAVVYLTTPTGPPAIAGLHVWNGAWTRLTTAATTGRIQYTQSTGGQSLPNTGAFTPITGFDSTADIDTFGGSTFNAVTGVWTCPTAGQYEVSGQVTATSGSARLIAAIQLNGTTRIHSNYTTGTSSTWATAVLSPREFTLAASDQITLCGLPNAASIVTVGGSVNGNSCYLRITRVS